MFYSGHALHIKYSCSNLLLQFLQNIVAHSQLGIKQKAEKKIQATQLQMRLDGSLTFEKCWNAT